MKLAVFDDFRLGVLNDSHVYDVTQTVPSVLDSWPEQRMNWLIRGWSHIAAELADLKPFKARPLDSVQLRAVNPAPGQVFAIPANYLAHIGELGDRAISTEASSLRRAEFFLKAAGSVSGVGEGIRLPAGSARRFDHECELGVVVGRGGRDIPRSEALEYVFGYTCLLDMTMRIEPGSRQEDRSMRKSFRTFTPTGPYLLTADEVSDWKDLTVSLAVNGEQRQSAQTQDMVLALDEMIELISSVVDIRPGDIIATGTPAGVGPVTVGDSVTISISGVGEMTLPVGEAEPSALAF